VDPSPRLTSPHVIHNERTNSDKTSGTRILLDLVKKEGPGAFFKGLTPKLIVIGPKLVFSFTVAQVRRHDSTRLDSIRGVVDGLNGMELRVYACSADAAPSPLHPIHCTATDGVLREQILRGTR